MPKRVHDFVDFQQFHERSFMKAKKNGIFMNSKSNSESKTGHCITLGRCDGLYVDDQVQSLQNFLCDYNITFIYEIHRIDMRGSNTGIELDSDL